MRDGQPDGLPGAIPGLDDLSIGASLIALDARIRANLDTIERTLGVSRTLRSFGNLPPRPPVPDAVVAELLRERKTAGVVADAAPVAPAPATPVDEAKHRSVRERTTGVGPVVAVPPDADAIPPHLAIDISPTGPASPVGPATEPEPDEPKAIPKRRRRRGSSGSYRDLPVAKDPDVVAPGVAPVGLSEPAGLPPASVSKGPDDDRGWGDGCFAPTLDDVPEPVALHEPGLGQLPINKEIKPPTLPPYSGDSVLRKIGLSELNAKKANGVVNGLLQRSSVGVIHISEIINFIELNRYIGEITGMKHTRRQEIFLRMDSADWLVDEHGMLRTRDGS